MAEAMTAATASKWRPTKDHFRTEAASRKRQWPPSFPQSQLRVFRWGIRGMHALEADPIDTQRKERASGVVAPIRYCKSNCRYARERRVRRFCTCCCPHSPSTPPIVSSLRECMSNRSERARELFIAGMRRAEFLFERCQERNRGGVPARIDAI